MNVHEIKKRALAGAAGTCVLAAAAALAGDDASITKDLHISQAPMVTNIVPTSSGPGEAGLSVFASADRGDGGAYKDGDKVRLSVEVSEDAYVWVYDTGTSGKVHQIFPNRFEEDNRARAGEAVSIPGPEANYDFQVSRPQGRELITVIATTSDRPLAPQLLQTEVSGGDGPFLALVGDAASVAKDLSISLREDHPVWTKAQTTIRIVE